MRTRKEIFKQESQIMKASQLVAVLTSIIDEYGDLELSKVSDSYCIDEIHQVAVAKFDSDEKPCIMLEALGDEENY